MLNFLSFFQDIVFLGVLMLCVFSVCVCNSKAVVSIVSTPIRCLKRVFTKANSRKNKRKVAPKCVASKVRTISTCFEAAAEAQSKGDENEIRQSMMTFADTYDNPVGRQIR